MLGGDVVALAAKVGDAGAETVAAVLAQCGERLDAAEALEMAEDELLLRGRARGGGADGCSHCRSSFLALARPEKSSLMMRMWPWTVVKRMWPWKVPSGVQAESGSLKA